METWTLSKKIYSLRRNGPRKIFTFQFFNLYLARYSDSCRRRLLVGGPPQMVVLVTKGSVTPKNAHEKSWKIDGETNPSLKWTSRTWTLEGKKTIFSFWDGPYFECNPHIGWLVFHPLYTLNNQGPYPEVPTNETFAMSYLMKALIEQHHPATSKIKDVRTEWALRVLWRGEFHGEMAEETPRKW